MAFEVSLAVRTNRACVGGAVVLAQAPKAPACGICVGAGVVVVTGTDLVPQTLQIHLPAQIPEDETQAANVHLPNCSGGRVRRGG